MLLRLWRDPVWSKVIAAGLLAVIAVAWTSVKGAWPAVGRAAVSAWAWVGSASQVANWLLVILWLLAGIAVAGIAVVIWESFTRGADKSTGSSWRNYKTDHFLGLKWRWDYTSNGEIIGIGVFCVRCDYQIRPVIEHMLRGEQTTFPCDECHHNVGPIAGSYYDVEDQVERKIHKRIRNDTWMRDEA